MANNENLYVRESLDHYKNIEYYKIFINENNDKNKVHFKDIIDDYIQDGFVEIINYRHRNNRTRPIFDTYKDCYSRNNKQ